MLLRTPSQRCEGMATGYVLAPMLAPGRPNQGLKAQARQQIVYLLLVRDDIGSTGGIHHGAV